MADDDPLAFNSFEAISPKKKPGKPAEQSWPAYMSEKLAPIIEGIGAGASSATRALGPLKGPLDAVMDPVAGAMQPLLGRPSLTGDENRARREKREQENPNAAEAGYKIGNTGRDAYLALNPYTRTLAMANRARNMAFGSGIGAESQLLDEYDRAVHQGKSVEPMEALERVTGATVGGGAGAMAGGAGVRRTPLAGDMASVRGGPLSAAELTATAKANQLAHAQKDTAPDLAQLMRLSGDERLATRAADIEGMYRKAKPLEIDEAEIAKHAAPGGGNRITGRLTSPPNAETGRATVAPEVLQQLDKRSTPGGFNAQIDSAAADLGTSQQVLERILNQPQRGPRVDAVTPPPGAIPQRTLNERNRIYGREVEAERAQPNNTYLTDAEAKRQVGSPEQMRFWDATLERLPPQDRAILEDVLGTIRGARPGQPGSAVGKGPPQVGPAIQDRTRAQRALNEYGDVQKSIGESFPYKPGEPPQLLITPPAFSKGFRVGLGVPGLGQGAASRGTTKAFQDPTAAAAEIGRLSPAELWAAFAGAEGGSWFGKRLAKGAMKHSD